MPETAGSSRPAAASIIPIIADFAEGGPHLAAATNVAVFSVIAAVFSALYLTTRTSDYSSDALETATKIIGFRHTHDRSLLLRPEFLLYQPLGLACWRAALENGYRGGVLPVLQTINCIFGGLGLGSLSLMLRTILARNRAISLLIPAALGCSFGYWMTATDARAQMPAIALSIAALALLLRSILLPQTGRIVWAGLATSAACLFHILALLVVPAGILAICLAEFTQGTPRAQRMARARALAAYLASALLPTTAMLLVAGEFAVKLRGASAWREWFAQGVPTSWWWSAHPFGNLRLDLYAFRRALFVEPGAKTGTFHLGSTHSLAYATLYWIALAAWFIAVYAILSATAFLLRSHYRPYLLVVLLYGGCGALLFTLLTPGDYLNWVPVVLGSAIVTAISSSYYYRRRRGGQRWVVGLLCWILVFGAYNYSETIRPHLSLSSNTWYHQASVIRRHTKPGDLLIVSGFGDDVRSEQYVAYFAHRAVFSLRGSLAAHHGSIALTSLDLRGAIAKEVSSGRHAYALGTIWSDADVRSRLQSDYGVGTPQLLFSGLQRAAAWQEPSGNGTATESVWKLLSTSASSGAKRPL